MAEYAADSPALEAALQGSPAGARLRLTEARTLGVIRDSAAEVSALSHALGE